MTPIEPFLLDLRTALGDRLPPFQTDERLREARTHLLMAEAEVGAKEALRRYGPARGVANAMVRVHRGYEAASGWRLALGPLALLVFVGAFQIVGSRWLAVGEQSLVRLEVMRGLTVVVLVLFAGRAFQTRRWLAAPVAACHFTLLLAILAAELALPPVWVVSELGPGGKLRQRTATAAEVASSQARHPRDLRAELRHTLGSLGGLALFEAQALGLLAVVNASAIALGTLSDRRRVRRV